MFVSWQRWGDLCIAEREVDAARIEQLVLPLLARGADRRDLATAVERALLVEYGGWIGGWTWSPHDGGPVRGWCCANHSIATASADDRASTVARIVAAVEDWRRLLDGLAELFAELIAETRGEPIARAVELAASRILPVVVERTGAEDAWHTTLATVITWYLEAAGFDRELAGPAVYEVISGRFDSWVAPQPEAARDAFSELGRVVAIAAATQPAPRDALAAWQRARASAFRGFTPIAVSPITGDGHLRYIDRVDRARDPDRAERMAAALVLSRDSASRGMALTVDQLIEWQAIVLGRRVELRTTDAFAKAGREHYPFTRTLRAALEAALADTDDEQPLAVRAARAYLDVCYFHPFEDGNARAARLALDHVLTRAGYALHAAEPVFGLSRLADDALVGWSLAFMVARLAGPRR